MKPPGAVATFLKTFGSILLANTYILNAKSEQDVKNISKCCSIVQMSRKNKLDVCKTIQKLPLLVSW